MSADNDRLLTHISFRIINNERAKVLQVPHKKYNISSEFNLWAEVVFIKTFLTKLWVMSPLLQVISYIYRFVILKKSNFVIIGIISLRFPACWGDVRPLEWVFPDCSPLLLLFLLLRFSAWSVGSGWRCGPGLLSPHTWNKVTLDFGRLEVTWSNIL